MLAPVDADYNSLWIDVGLGHMPVTQIFNASELKEWVDDGTIGLPEPIRYGDQDMPYFILGDDAFGLRKYPMKPYSRRITYERLLVYNYMICGVVVWLRTVLASLQCVGSTQ